MESAGSELRGKITEAAMRCFRTKGYDAVYQIIYAWCCRRGNYPVRARARQVTEMIGSVAPEYRWTMEQLEHADK